MIDPPHGLGLGAAFDWFRERGERGLVGVRADALMADAEASPVLAVFAHRDIWRWARDQSQAVLGWQPLPFIDGRRARLLWTDLSDTGVILGAVATLPPAADGPFAPDDVAAADHLVDVFPGVSDAAHAIRGHLHTLLSAPLSLRIVGGRGSGKGFVAAHLIDRSAGGHMDPLTVPGHRAWERVWVSRLDEAVERRRPIHLHHLDQIPEPRIHALLTPLRRARERRVPVVATQTRRLTPFAERMWAKTFDTTVTLPDLDGRPEDIPTIAQALWRANFGTRARLRLDRDAVRLLAGASWLGNVAELESVLLEARARTGMDRLAASALRVPARRVGTSTRLEDVEAAAIVHTLERTGGNRSEAAALLGISRSSLYRKLPALGLSESAQPPRIGSRRRG